MQMLKFIFQEENDKTGLLVIVYFIDHFTYKTVMIYSYKISYDKMIMCTYVYTYTYVQDWI